MEHVISRTHHCIDEGGDREKLVVEMRLGTHIDDAISEVAILAISELVPVEFRFNGMTYRISPQRILDLAASMVVAES